MIRCAGIVLFLFSVCSLHAQNKISGKVLNNYNLAPLANVIVTVKDGASILSYTKTNNKGRFELKTAEKGNFKIVFRKNGFLTLEETLSKGNNTYLMAPNPEEPVYMEVVVVNAQKSYLHTSKDTITFVADSLRTSPVTTVGDLIDNIPGVSIDPQSGKIKYQNKEIATILIDGDNVTDQNYQLISKNLTQKAAKAIQIIEGYTENSNLKNFERSNNTALNLQIEDDYKNKLTGSMKAGYGIKDRYDESVKLFSFSEKLKTIHLAAYNNVGNFSLGNIVSNKNLGLNKKPLLNFNALNTIHLSGNFDQKVIFGLYNSRNILQNDDFTLSTNQLYNFGPDGEAKINATFYTDKLSFFSSEKFIPLDTKNPVLSNTLAVSKSVKNYDIKLYFKKTLNANETLLVRGNIKTRNRKIQENGTQNTEDITIHTDIENPEVQLLVDYSRKINSKSALVLFNNLTVAALNEETLLSSTDQIYHPYLLDLKTAQGIQKSDRIFFRSNSGINYAYKFTPNTVLTSALLYTHYAFNSNSLYEAPSADSIFTVLENHIDGTINFLSPQLQWAHFGKRGRISVLAKIDYLSHENKGQRLHDLEFTPSVNYEFKQLTPQFNTFRYGLGYQRSLMMYDFISRGPDPVQQSIHYFYVNNHSDLYYISNRFSGSIAYEIRKSDLLLDLNSSYSFGTKPLINRLTFYDNFYVSEAVGMENPFRNFSVGLGLEKFLSDISTNIEITPRFRYYSWENIVGNTQYENTLHNYRMRFGAGSVFPSFLNFSLGAILSHSIIFQMDAAHNKSELATQKNVAYLNFNFNFLDQKLIINLENEYVNYDQTNHFLYSSITATYTPSGSSFHFGLDFRNLWDNRNYFSKNQTLNYLWEKEISILPRMLIFDATYYISGSE